MKKTLAVFLVMAIVGIGAAFIFAQNGGRGGFEGKRFGNRGFGRFAEKLNLTDEQKSQIKLIREESKTRVKPLMEAMRENRKQNAGLGQDGVFDEEQVNRIAGVRAETIKQLFVEREKTKAQIFAVLTPEQRAEAAKLKGQFHDRLPGKGKKRFGGRTQAPATDE
ncbi:MAG TPA: Spy/CpxP family protein refolding chaperone [Pyrinomonadaceae bacterium]|jgi:protein CpxP